MSNFSPPTRFYGIKERRSRFRGRKGTISLNPDRWTHIHLLRAHVHFSTAYPHTLIPPPLTDAETTLILNPADVKPADVKRTLSDDEQELRNLSFAALYLEEGNEPIWYLQYLINHFFHYPNHPTGPTELELRHNNWKAQWRPLADAPHKGVWATDPENPKSHMAEEVGCFVAIMLASPEKSKAPLLFTVRHYKVLLLRARRNEEYLERLMAETLREEDQLVVETLAAWDLDSREHRLELAKVLSALARSKEIIGL